MPLHRVSVLPAGLPECPQPRALVHFHGFGRGGARIHPHRVLLLGAGHPDAVASWLKAALAAVERPSQLAGLCLRNSPAPWRIACPRDDDLADYRYRLTLAGRGGLTLECWRRYGEAIGWQRRFGPMPLRQFLGLRR